jgi:hypothetical protein
MNDPNGHHGHTFDTTAFAWKVEGTTSESGCFSLGFGSMYFLGSTWFLVPYMFRVTLTLSAFNSKRLGLKFLGSHAPLLSVLTCGLRFAGLGFLL